MKILGIDLGKYNSVACLFDTQTQDTLFFSFKSIVSEFSALFRQSQPDQVVIEACSISGWVYDLCQSEGFQIIVANPTHEAWNWKNVKRKTDKDDALKLTKLAALNQLIPVYMPPIESRQYRQLIKYRKSLVSRVTQSQDRIRALFNQQGIAIPVRSKAWTIAGLDQLTKYAKELSNCPLSSIWKGQLDLELKHLDASWEQLQIVDSKLTELANTDPRVQLLESIPGVGRKTAEVIVAYIDNPNRFQTARQVGAYAGLVPRQHQSGETNRMGKITRRGPRVLRTALVEAAWIMQRYNPWAAALFQRICGGQKTRRKQATVAVARKLLVLCWRLLKKQEKWDSDKVRPVAA
jgi:transposase